VNNFFIFQNKMESLSIKFIIWLKQCRLLMHFDSDVRSYYFIWLAAFPLMCYGTVLPTLLRFLILLFILYLVIFFDVLVFLVILLPVTNSHCQGFQMFLEYFLDNPMTVFAFSTCFITFQLCYDCWLVQAWSQGRCNFSNLTTLASSSFYRGPDIALPNSK
jgi:hypothetical protein